MIVAVNLGDYFEPVQGGKFSTFGDVASLFYQVILIIAGIAVFFLLIYGGIQYITSGGDQKKTEAARNTLTAAIIGFALIVIAMLVFPTLQNFFGLPKIF